MDIVIILIFISIFIVTIVARVFYKKGVDEGRNQILQENLIRLKNDLYRFERDNGINNDLLKKFAYLTEEKL
jgi:hypothetical protein